MGMTWSTRQRNRRLNRCGLAAAGILVGGLAFSGWPVGAAAAAAPDRVSVTLAPSDVQPAISRVTVPMRTGAATVLPATTPVTTPTPVTDPAATAAPATDAATTAPATDPATTVPAADPATAAPADPLPPIPSNIEVVGASSVPVPAVGKGGGSGTKIVQLRLLQLGFWNAGASGKYDNTTQQAVMAFQKYLNLPASGKVDANTATWLTALDTKAHGLTDTGTLMEVDKGHQLLFAVVDGKTNWTFNTSTATGKTYHEVDKNTPGQFQDGVSITPDGLWKTNRERPVGWWEGDLGQIYRPKYFHGGVAIHGSNSIPNYPASHGCVRLSVQAMDWIWANNVMPLGITVWVHE
ncbi:MAG: hypothetical protein JWM34_1318 [Ilumatobacteraceae bacterium]|nr:hypothetical protein [Ilumatobacteraceae bacterium]